MDKDELAKEPVSEEEKVKVFIEQYNALCKVCGFSLAAQPTWVQTNHGSFEMVVQAVVVKMGQN